MTLAQCICATLVLAAGSLPASTSAKAEECTHGCLVEIEGLKTTYSAGSRVDVTIHNLTKHNLHVNVAIEGLESGAWLEIVGSVSDPRHSFDKMVTLSQIKGGASLKVTFDPCETVVLVKTGDSLGLSEHPCTKPITVADIPAALRLRVNVHLKIAQKWIIQKVRTREFQLLLGKQSP